MINRPPRVLFLAYYLPPCPASGSVRCGAVARQLSGMGWDVSVVAPDPSLLRAPDNLERVTAEMDRLGVRRIYTGHRWRCLSSGFLKRSYRGLGWFLGGICRVVARKAGIDEMSGWFPEAFRACAGLAPDDVDVILATGNPWGTFEVARRLGKRLGRPFVLDYRDPWTADNPHTPSPSPRLQRTEAMLLARCAAVSVVSPSWAMALEKHFALPAGKVRIVWNGYDMADYAGVERLDFGHFAVVYTGLFLPPKRDVAPLMSALKCLEETGVSGEWRFHYYGPDHAHVRAAAQTHGLQDRVVMHGVVPRRECLAAVRGAGAAVIIASVENTCTLGDKGIVTGKIFEPIGLGTPLLVIAPPGSDLESVVQTAGKGRVFPGTDTQGMAAYLGDLMRGIVPPSNRPEAYSWPHLIAEMDGLLRRAAALPEAKENPEPQYP